MMILTDSVLTQSPNSRLVAIHNHNQDGSTCWMNFELSGGSVTCQTSNSTMYRHVIPDAVFTHTRKVLVHIHSDGYCIDGFRFLDADG